MSGRRAISGKKFLWGLLVLLAAPLVVLLLFAAYVYWANSRPQPGPLRTRVEPAVVFPRGEATYFMDFRGLDAEAPAPPPPPVDIAFLIDVSGSMTRSLPDMANAAHTVAQELASESPGRIRFALIRFDTEAEVITPWTEDPEQLYAGLRRLRYIRTGENDTRAAFEALDGLLSQTRAGAKQVAVFYTDGELEACNPDVCPRGPMTEEEMRQRAAGLRGNAVEIYSIGLPGEPSAPLMVEMSGDRSHVFDPVDARDLANNFRLAARSIVGVTGEGGQLTHRLDGRHFAAPVAGTAWGLDRSGALTLGVGKLPQASVTFAHPVVPLSSGLWRVGVEPPRLNFAGEDGKLHSIQAARRPLMLVVGWGALLWGLLPAALWTLFFLLPRTPEVKEREPPPLPGILRDPPPTPFPSLPAPAEGGAPRVPTLFVGLGGAGRRALLVARGDLKQAHIGGPDQPYRFLWLDLDPTEAGSAAPFEEWEDYPVEELIAPAEVRRTHAFLPEPGSVAEHLSWFDAPRYVNVTREELNLSDGSRGDRMLARLSLFRWLAEAGEPLSTLARLCEELDGFDSADGTRQIVIFASPDGGVGSGWFIDVGRLLRRLTRARQQAGGGSAPEIIGVLCASSDRPRAENRRALETEYESAALAGAFPQRMTYAPSEAGASTALEGTDTESPYNWVFKTSAFVPDSAAGQAAELSAVLVEQRPRGALLGAADSLAQRRPLAAQTHSVHILPAQLYEQLHHELFLRIIGPDTLLDIVPSAQGGFSPRVMNEESAARLLADWVRIEPSGTPLHLLLAAASDTALAPGFLRVMQGGTAVPNEDWFSSAFCAAVTARLRGRPDPDGAQWRRGWTTSEAVAALRLLAARLENSVAPDVRAMGGQARAEAVVGHVAGLARAAADQLGTWVADFCIFAERASRRREDFERARAQLEQLEGRTHLAPLGEDERVARWTRLIFEKWLGTPDVTSAVRERLYFSASPTGDSLRVALSSYIDGAREFASTAEANEAIDRQARLLARAAPAARIGGALAKEAADARLKLARGLVDVTSAPRYALVVAPDAYRLGGAEAGVIEEFRRLVPQPPSHGRRLDGEGNDHAAVRRVELTEEPRAEEGDAFEERHLPLIVAAEQEAELLRLRAEKKYNLAVARFPPELRAALANRAGFLSFAHAYRAGRIVKREDAAGARQWFAAEPGEFLTFGESSTLAQAAANYVWYVAHDVSEARSGDGTAAGGDFARLEQWRRQRNSPDDDVLTLLAIDVYEG
jgi:hypothetical protein